MAEILVWEYEGNLWFYYLFVFSFNYSILWVPVTGQAMLGV